MFRPNFVCAKHKKSTLIQQAQVTYSNSYRGVRMGSRGRREFAALSDVGTGAIMF